jgi:hypothetical protein
LVALYILTSFAWEKKRGERTEAITSAMKPNLGKHVVILYI